tara:strand:+ start:2707 stop:2967 length:261 start_codon:yes stop_codon:yes gene_type:complete
MRKKRYMTQAELNALTDKSLNAYVLYDDGKKIYVKPENNRFFSRKEIHLVVGDDIKITQGEKNMLVLQDYKGKIKEKLLIRKDQIR